MIPEVLAGVAFGDAGAAVGVLKAEGRLVALGDPLPRIDLQHVVVGEDLQTFSFPSGLRVEGRDLHGVVVHVALVPLPAVLGHVGPEVRRSHVRRPSCESQQTPKRPIAPVALHLEGLSGSPLKQQRRSTWASAEEARQPSSMAHWR